MEKLNQLLLPPSITISSDCLLGKSHNRIFSCGKQNLPSQSHIPPKPTSGNLFVSQETLSDKFSIGSFFRVLTKLSNLKVLSLVSLGLWGQLPATINRLKSLEKLNISSNFISGEIPGSISVLTNLTSLVLADNLFNGSVPDMKSLQSLQEIDLSINRLKSEFPSMSTNLATIKLKNNSLRSGIPSQIKDFDLLQRFYVSGNKLVGPIPSPLFSLPSIQYLNLDDNQYNGALSLNLSCSVNLTFVDISSNFLIGKLPACVGSNATNRIVLSSWNCLTSGGLEYQHPYSFCQKEALAVIPPNTNREGQSKGKRYFGGVVGVVFVVGLLILIIFRREKKKKKKKKDDSFECNSFVSEKSSVRSEPAIDGRHVPQTMTMLLMGLPPYHVFTLEEMEDATNNFDPSNLAGKGSQGQLYRGWLRDGLICLVKCLKVETEAFATKLAAARGSDIEAEASAFASTVFIVLEHVANGSLRDHLTDWIKREYLKWPQRRRIAVGIARGIQFSHSRITPGMYGNDLKIENTLLDKTLTAKISSYNISLPSKKVGSESPLNGQDNPNWLSSTEKWWMEGLLKLQLERGLAESPLRLREAIDPSIRGTFSHESLKTAVKITMKCLSKDSISHPTIEDVLRHMQYSIQVQEGWTSSGNLSTKV
ncbi:unnamed protein product [Camellia sinensis]